MGDLLYSIPMNMNINRRNNALRIVRECAVRQAQGRISMVSAYDNARRILVHEFGYTCHDLMIVRRNALAAAGIK